MKNLKKVISSLLIIMGAFFTLMIILAFTTAPFWMRYGLGTKNAGIHRPPDYIILLGGGGMPSESALMRCWYTAQIAAVYPRSRVIIAEPGNGNDSLSTLREMKRELLLRGITEERILFEDSGTNTRAQAVNFKLKIRNYELEIKDKSTIVNCQSSILLVTSPEHMYRAILTFKKAGFLKVDGLPAFEKDVETDLSFDSMKLGGRRMIPDIGENLTVRYKFWTHLEYETLITREYLALGYYKLMGWI
ncbi:MAG: YdcF family protein [Bacteroidota bacterium]